MRLTNKISQFFIAFFFSIFSLQIYAATPPGFATTLADCDAGVTQQCLNAGVALIRGSFKGQKIPKNKNRAKIIVDQAVKRGQQNCLEGDNMECYTLGLLFFEGGGVVPTDIPRGLDFLQRSCRNGFKKACAWLDNSGLGK